MGPSFFYMEFKAQVQKLLEEGLAEHPSLFLIDFKVGGDGAIHVVLDGDQGVRLQDCMDISRHIEHNLDREEHDFSLEVASVGVDAPLQKARQYIKNVGRQLEVENEAGQTFKGKLTHADQDSCTLQWKQREPKPIGKGKHTVEKIEQLNYSQIKRAKVLVQF
ncbi:MAG: ribosome assembly cofactor RimP [Flavobacteriaceae bacterium]